MTKMTLARPDLARDEVFEQWGKATAELFQAALRQLDPDAALEIDAAIGAGASFALAATLDPPAVRGLLDRPGAEPLTLFEIHAPDDGVSAEIH